MIKKLLLITIAIGMIFWISVCFLIPATLQIVSSRYIKVPVSTVTNLAIHPDGWQRWWPGNNDKSSYSYQDYQYRITGQNPFSAQVFAQAANDTFTSQLTILPLPQDSALAEWKTALITSINPFTRIRQYNHAVSIKKDLNTLLDSLSAFASNKQNIYGNDIQKVKFTNPFMITTQTTTPAYPAIENIYKTINTLRVFAEGQQAVAVDSPMINIERTDANYYRLRAALPINKKLGGNTIVEAKQMVLGNTLLSTVTGGRYTIEQALLQMRNYANDYRLTSPAIPFQLLITNRQQQTDSSKWITKLYYPVY